MSNLLEGALWWAERGVPVFPCGANKAPLTAKGHKDAVSVPSEVKQLFKFYENRATLIGARMGPESGLFCMDFDLYKGDQPKLYMERLLASGALPDSRTHRTMQGGLHVFYRSETEWPNLKPCPGVEVKGDGGYVIVPPSPGYEVINDAQTVLAPIALIDELHRSRDIAATASIDDLKFAVMEATDFHDSLRTIAARLSSRGTDPVEVVLELKRLLAASAASDPDHPRHSRWKGLVRDKSQELTRIVKSGYVKYNPVSQDNRLLDVAEAGWEDTATAAGFRSLPSEGEQPAEEPVVLEEGVEPWDHSYDASDDIDVSVAKPILRDLIAENEMALLYAEPKAGKTTVAIGMCFHVAIGKDYGSLQVPEAGPTLYFALEGIVAIRKRVRAVRMQLEADGVEMPKRIPMVTVEDRFNLMEESQRVKMANSIAHSNDMKIKDGSGPYKIIVIDTLTRAMPGGDQNSVSDTSALFDIVALLRERGITASVMFIHHAGKDGTSRGSTNLTAEPDIVLAVNKFKNEDHKLALTIQYARSVDDGSVWNFEMTTVQVGTDDFGFPIDGAYAKPITSTVDQAVSDLGVTREDATRLEQIIAMGAGEHTLAHVHNLLNTAKVGPLSPRGRQYTLRGERSMDMAQKYYGGLIGNLGRIFAGHALALNKNKDEKILSITITRIDQY